jgi:hypothetical protein
MSKNHEFNAAIEKLNAAAVAVCCSRAGLLAEVGLLNSYVTAG